MSTRPTRSDVERTVRAVRGVLDPSLLRPEHRDRAHPMAGHCYVAAESVYHLIGGQGAGAKPVTARHEGSVHWWLQIGEWIIDPTADQFTTPVPYHDGRGRGFLTKQPSARAREVIRRVREGTLL